MFHFLFLHYTFSSVWLLSGHFLGNSCPFGKQFVLIVFCLFVIFIFFPFLFYERDLPFDCASSCSLLFYYFHPSFYECPCSRKNEVNPIKTEGTRAVKTCLQL